MAKKQKSKRSRSSYNVGGPLQPGSPYTTAASTTGVAMPTPNIQEETTNPFAGLTRARTMEYVQNAGNQAMLQQQNPMFYSQGGPTKSSYTRQSKNYWAQANSKKKMAVGGPYSNINPLNPQGYSDNVFMEGQAAQTMDLSDSTQRKMKRRQIGRDIGAAAYGALEGVLDTVTFGLTDQITDAGYDALAKAGRSQTAAQRARNERWRTSGQFLGATAGAFINPAAIGSAIGTTDIENFANEESQGLQTGLKVAGTVAGIAAGTGGTGGTGKTGAFDGTPFGDFSKTMQGMSPYGGDGNAFQNLYGATAGQGSQMYDALGKIGEGGGKDALKLLLQQAAANPEIANKLGIIPQSPGQTQTQTQTPEQTQTPVSNQPIGSTSNAFGFKPSPLGIGRREPFQLDLPILDIPASANMQLPFANGGYRKKMNPGGPTDPPRNGLPTFDPQINSTQAVRDNTQTPAFEDPYERAKNVAAAGQQQVLNFQNQVKEYVLANNPEATPEQIDQAIAQTITTGKMPEYIQPQGQYQTYGSSGQMLGTQTFATDPKVRAAQRAYNDKYGYSPKEYSPINLLEPMIQGYRGIQAGPVAADRGYLTNNEYNIDIPGSIVAADLLLPFAPGLVGAGVKGLKAIPRATRAGLRAAQSRGFLTPNTPDLTKGLTLYSGVDPREIRAIFKQGTKNFQSEINWGNWNPDTPKYPELIKQYNAIEEATKKAGTWMKNADGTPFTLADGSLGTPEQFIQMNSIQYQRAFPGGSNVVYRGTGVSNSTPTMVAPGTDPNRAVFAADEDLAKLYTYRRPSGYTTLTPQLVKEGTHFKERVPGVFKLAVPKNSGKNLSFNAEGDHWTSIRLAGKNRATIETRLNQAKKRYEDLASSNTPNAFDLKNQQEKIKILEDLLKSDLVSNPQAFNEMRAVLGDRTITDNIANYINKTDLNSIQIKNVTDGGLGDVTIINRKPGMYPKSLVGNVGFFDMTNPDVFKALAGVGTGIGLTLGAARTSPEINTYGKRKTFAPGGPAETDPPKLIDIQYRRDGKLEFYDDGSQNFIPNDGSAPRRTTPTVMLDAAEVVASPNQEPPSLFDMLSKDRTRNQVRRRLGDQGVAELNSVYKAIDQERKPYVDNFLTPLLLTGTAMAAGPTVGAALEAADAFAYAAYPYVSSAVGALSTPFTIGSTTIPGLTAGNIIGGGFALKGADNLSTDMNTGFYSNPNIPTSQKVERGIITGLDLLGTPGMGNALLQTGKGVFNLGKQAGKLLTTKTPVKNAWRLNPKAYQYNLPQNTLWRGIGKEGMEDALQSGVFRPKPNVEPSGGSFDISKTFDNTYYSPRFKIADRYGKGYLAEVPKDAANFGRRYKGSDWSMSTKEQIPINEGRILQKDWLRGYKPVDMSNAGTRPFQPGVIGANPGASVSTAGISAPVTTGALIDDAYFRSIGRPDITTDFVNKSVETLRAAKDRTLNALRSPEGKQRFRNMLNQGYLEQKANKLTDAQFERIYNQRLQDVEDAFTHSYNNRLKSLLGKPVSDLKFPGTSYKDTMGQYAEGMARGIMKDNAFYSKPFYTFDRRPASTFGSINLSKNKYGLRGVKSSTSLDNTTRPYYVPEKFTHDTMFSDMPPVVPGTVSLGTGFGDDMVTAMHEYGHLLQQGQTTPFERQLIALAGDSPNYSIFNAYSKPNIADDILPKAIRDTKESIKREFDYFTKSGGRDFNNEPFAFQTELRNAMLENKLLKNYYDPITPQKLAAQRILEYGKFNPLSNKKVGQQVQGRMLTFLDPSKYAELSQIMNRTPLALTGIAGATGVGLAASGNPEINTYRP